MEHNRETMAPSIYEMSIYEMSTYEMSMYEMRSAHAGQCRAVQGSEAVKGTWPPWRASRQQTRSDGRTGRPIARHVSPALSACRDATQPGPLAPAASPAVAGPQ